jgi:hypothetical protein
MQRFASESAIPRNAPTQDAAILHQPTEHQQVRGVADVHSYGNAVSLE